MLKSEITMSLSVHAEIIARLIGFLIMLLCHNLDGVHSTTVMSNVDKLMKDKMKDYNKLLIPRYNKSEPLHVSMGFDLIAIRDFDEVTEKFSVVGVVYMIWNDGRMAWDPKEYGDLDEFVMDNSNFWTPPLILVNAFDRFEKVGSASYWPIRFYSRGLAVFYPGHVFTTTCSVDVELYPWDTQVCSLMFTVWGHPKEEVMLIQNVGYEKVSLTYFSGNGEWDLVDTSVGSVNGIFFEFVFTMKRKPLFILVNTLVPIIIMSLLNILAFLIPVASGERLSYCITVLLAVAVFLTLIGDTMPRSATTIAVLCYYLVCVLALSMLIIVASIISMRIYQRGEAEQVSPCWATFVRLLRCGCRRKRRTRYEAVEIITPRNESSQTQISEISTISHSTGQTVALPDMHTKLSHLNKDRSGKRDKHVETGSGNGHHGYLEENHVDNRNDENVMITWKDVSSSLDMMFFVLAVIILAIFTGIFFTYTLVSSS